MVFKSLSAPLSPLATACVWDVQFWIITNLSSLAIYLCGDLCMRYCELLCINAVVQAHVEKWWWWCNFISCKFQTLLYVLLVNWSSRCFDCLYASAMEIRRLNFELYSSISAVCQRFKAEYEVTLRQRRLHTASTLGAPQTLKWNRPCWSNSDTLCHRCLYGGQLASFCTLPKGKYYIRAHDGGSESFFFLQIEIICLCSNWLIFFGATLGFAAASECILFHLAHSALPLWYCEAQQAHKSERV